jgi:putative nucleotidyltransferase with HDIG domain
MFLGTETLRALILSLQVFAQYRDLPEFDLDGLWRHSWRTAVLARRICEHEEIRGTVASESFIAGLLHDLGKLVIASNHPELYRATLELAQRKAIAFWEAEYAIYNTSHAELGAYLLSRWGLSEGVVEAVAFHHRPALSRSENFTALTAVHAANVFSKSLVRNDASVSTPIDNDYLEDRRLGRHLQDWQELCATAGEPVA